MLAIKKKASPDGVMGVFLYLAPECGMSSLGGLGTWAGNSYAVEGTLNSLLQHHNSKSSILQCSAFFTVQLSHPYMTTGVLTYHLSKRKGPNIQMAVKSGNGDILNTGMHA